jgi:hypothetical protein
MEAMRTRWNDHRLDDLKTSVDELSRRIDGLQNTMIIVAVGMCTMMFAGFGAVLALIATQL